MGAAQAGHQMVQGSTEAMQLVSERNSFKDRFEAAVMDRQVFETELLLLMEEWFNERNATASGAPPAEVTNESVNEKRRIRELNIELETMHAKLEHCEKQLRDQLDAQQGPSAEHLVLQKQVQVLSSTLTKQMTLKEAAESKI